MNEEKSMRKEQFLRETERQLRMAQSKQPAGVCFVLDSITFHNFDILCIQPFVLSYIP